MSQDTAAVNEPVVTQDATPTESAPVETNAPEVAEKSEFSKALLDDDSPAEVDTEVETTEPEPTGDDQQDTDETQTEEQPRGKGYEKRNEQLDQTIAAEKDRLGIDPNVEIRNKVELANYMKQLQSVDLRNQELSNEQELLNSVNPETGDYYTVAEAQRIARQQAIEAEQESNQNESQQLQIQQNRSIIDSESQKVITEFPMFDPKFGPDGKPTNPDFNPVAAQNAAALMEANLIRDPNVPEIDPSTGQATGKGMIIGAYASPYQIYSTIAAASQSSRTEGQIQGQRNTEQMLANADTAPGTAPAKPKVDAFRQGFYSED